MWDKLCVSKLCVDKLRVIKLCVSKLCVDKLCVSKLCVDKLCVIKLCVSKLCVEEAGGGRGGRRKRAGEPNQKQEPHTKMWGIIIAHDSHDHLETMAMVKGQPICVYIYIYIYLYKVAPPR